MKYALHLSLTLLIAFSLLQLHAFAQPPNVKVNIVEPEAGQQITGIVKVRVAVEGTPIPKSMFVGLGKLNWREMSRVEPTGEWIGTIDSTLVPNGQQVFRIYTDNRKVGTAQNVRVENPLKVFFSDLHSHCGYSDGALVPAVAHEYARDVAKVDAFCLTGHLEQVDDMEWIDTRVCSGIDGDFYSSSWWPILSARGPSIVGAETRRTSAASPRQLTFA